MSGFIPIFRRVLVFETLCGCRQQKYEAAGSSTAPLPEINLPLRLPWKIHFEVGKSEFASDIAQVSTMRARRFLLERYTLHPEEGYYEFLYREKG